MTSPLPLCASLALLASQCTVHPALADTTPDPHASSADEQARLRPVLMLLSCGPIPLLYDVGSLLTASTCPPLLTTCHTLLHHMCICHTPAWLRTLQRTNDRSLPLALVYCPRMGSPLFSLQAVQSRATSDTGAGACRAGVVREHGGRVTLPGRLDRSHAGASPW